MGSQRTTIEVTSRTFALPADCPCCGATSDREVAVPLARAARERVAPDSARAVDVPYCRSCAEHAAAWGAAGVLSAGLSVLGVLAGLAVGFAASPLLGASVAIGGIVIAFAFGAARRGQAARGCRESCSCPQLAVSYLGWSGQATALAFESKSYAAKFAEQNTARLLEDAGVRKLLERYKLARAAVPTPAAAVQAIPPPPNASEWIARLSSTTGRVARRGALARALDALADERERDQVVRAVAAIELAAAMASIERLAGPAKQRELARAIAHARADNMPDELRAVLVRDLEARR
jgi:hypothetical protein